MTHPNPEHLALLVGGELGALEAARVEAHLTRCPDCRGVVADFRRQAQTLRASVLALDVPVLPALGLPARQLPGGRPAHRRAWLPLTAAAVVLVMMLMGGGGPRIASAFTRLLSFVQLQELTPQETSDLAHKMSGPQQPGRLCDTYAELAPAEEAWGGRAMQPQYLPEGYAPSRYTACAGRLVTDYQNIHGHVFTITQGPADGEMTVQVPEGTGTEVSVSGEPALLLRGNWVGISDGHGGMSYNWDGESGITLLFEREGSTFSIYRLSGTILPEKIIGVDELIRIAESIR